MTADPVREALEAAAMKQCCDTWDEMDADDRVVAMSFTAPAIAAFLRALTDDGKGPWVLPDDKRALAAAVLAAAKEGA